MSEEADSIVNFKVETLTRKKGSQLNAEKWKTSLAPRNSQSTTRRTFPTDHGADIVYVEVVETSLTEAKTRATRTNGEFQPLPWTTSL